MARKQILEQQAVWASSRRLSVDPKGYVSTVAANLFVPLSPRTRAALLAGSGGELKDRGAKVGKPAIPAKMRALHSSATLAVNVFDYWVTCPRDLGSVLERPLASVEFEAQYPTGLRGTPPNIDVELRWADRSVTGVESKFTEWMAPNGAKKPFKGKYFANRMRLWEARGLGQCQDLAERLQKSATTFECLNVGQLLKHTLGLANWNPGRVSLWYLYYDAPGTLSATHREELEQFQGLVGKEMDFRAMTYQSLFALMRTKLASDHSAYLSYLGSRYFGEPATNPRTWLTGRGCPSLRPGASSLYDEADP